MSFSELTPYNTTVEELEVRVERLEEDMFQVEVAIIEVETEVGDLEISVNEIQFTLQETIETVFFYLSSQFGSKIHQTRKPVAFCKEVIN